MKDCFVLFDIRFSIVITINKLYLINCGMQIAYERASPKYIHFKVLDNYMHFTCCISNTFGFRRVSTSNPIH